MDNIVAHSLEKLYMELINIDQNFLDSDLKGMDAYEKDLATAFRRAVADHMQSMYSSIDDALCKDICRDGRYSIQRHDTRILLTVNGAITFSHTLFKKRDDGSYHYLLDERMGLDPHERPSCVAESEVLKEAVKSSYIRASKALGEDAHITKTAVMNKVHAIRIEIPFGTPKQKKCVEYLYIEADEDYIHKQDVAEREKKKSCMIGKLLYLYEGCEEKYGCRDETCILPRRTVWRKHRKSPTLEPYAEIY